MGTETSQQIDINHWVLRIIAFVIDSIIIGVVAYIIWSFAIVSLLFSGGLYGFWLSYGFSLFLPFVVGIIEVIYFVVLEMAWSATIGKRIMGLKVQMENGSKVEIGKSFIRNISKIYWIFVALDGIIALVTPGSDRHQKYTDRIAGTTVVKVGQAFASIPVAQKTS